MANKTISSVSKGSNDFGYKLHKILARKEGNVFFSPMSAHAILALAYQGTSGDTSKVFQSTLNMPEAKLTADGYKLIMTDLNSMNLVSINVANKVFVAEAFKLKDSFKSVACEHFLSEAENINFIESASAAKKINNWVEDKTNGKIKELILARDLNALTRLVLINAIYFKGDWMVKFKPTATKTEPFYVSETDTVECQMMHLGKNTFDYVENEVFDSKILKFPYKCSDVALIIFLPNKINGVKDLEAKVLDADFSTIINNMIGTKVLLSMPKFKIETTMELNEPLKELGLGIMFEDKAEFPNMVDSTDPLKVSKVLQKAFISVDENGTEAAAVTHMEFMLGCSMQRNPETPIKFCVDRPFVFAIAYKDHVLFHGKIVNPTV